MTMKGALSWLGLPSVSAMLGGSQAKAESPVESSCKAKRRSSSMGGNSKAGEKKQSLLRSMMCRQTKVCSMTTSQKISSARGVKVPPEAPFGPESEGRPAFEYYAIKTLDDVLADDTAPVEATASRQSSKLKDKRKRRVPCIAIDDATFVPQDLYLAMMKAAEEAEMRGQHILIEEDDESTQGGSSRCSTLSGSSGASSGTHSRLVRQDVFDSRNLV
eukprot:TRINITY_DN80262_c0_g1_i1.p1 TRINITY_DN80262_c0_g1~~TRINITY_DN80262_c0_g1_i1.p1  ORF type:complete len:217 (-),score=52.74 TRINITY_DN80262_c0_g1_i1:338-988(-)